MQEFVPEDHIMSFFEYERYKNGEPDNAINKFWNKVIENMPEPFKSEAKEKGFELKELTKSSFDKSFYFEVPDATDDLAKYIRDNVYNHITCLLD